MTRPSPSSMRSPSRTGVRLTPVRSMTIASVRRAPAGWRPGRMSPRMTRQTRCGSEGGRSGGASPSPSRRRNPYRSERRATRPLEMDMNRPFEESAQRVCSVCSVYKGAAARSEILDQCEADRVEARHSLEHALRAVQADALGDETGGVKALVADEA